MYYPDGAEIARRFVKFAPARAERFEQGVRNPTKDWKTETKAAEKNYEEGVKKGIARKAFGVGVEKCGTDKQMSQTIKNIPRWAEGIEGAEDIMTAAMNRVAAVAKTIVLPPPYPKGDERNYLRNKAVGMAFRKAKEEGKF